MKKQLFIFLCILLVGSVLSCSRSTSYSEKHLIVVLRDIGHRVLLYSHDSTSRVLPVEKIADNTYQISFQNSFTFVPDTLIKVVHSQLKKSFSPTDYIVSVVECSSLKVFFAFEMSSRKDSLVPCSGRTPPLGCYMVQIEFLNENSLSNNLYWAFFVVPLGILGFLIYRRNIKTKKNIQATQEDENLIKIGHTHFYPEKRYLRFNTEEIELSTRESKVLRILAENQNQIIERERLMKEVWEDDGVIVISRNLDVLISKLRKKLHQNPDIQIINSHGKGYKLTIS